MVDGASGAGRGELLFGWQTLLFQRRHLTETDRRNPAVTG